MKRIALAALTSCALAAPAAADAQTWGDAPPTIITSAIVPPVRQFKAGSAVDLSFGTEGIEPGVTKTVAPEAADAATGTGAKVDIRFNTGTKITVTGTALTWTSSTGTVYTISSSFNCAVATDQTGTGKVNFPGTCAAGYEFPNSSITGMMTRSVLIGATVTSSETETKPAATYTGSFTITLSASSS